MNREYFKKYYHIERHHWWFRVRERILMAEIKRRTRFGQPILILNIGAATGRTSQALQAFGHVLSVEYDRDSYLFCLNELKLSVVQASITDLPFPAEHFDWVCAFDVIEHVEDDQMAVSEMKRVCKPGGHVFVSVPALQSLWSRHDEVNHHFRRYSLGSLKQLFQNANGNIVRTTFFNTLLLPPIYIARKWQRVQRKIGKDNITSDFDLLPSRCANIFFRAIFSIERFLLSLIDLPVGVSLFVLWQKADDI